MTGSDWTSGPHRERDLCRMMCARGSAGAPLYRVSCMSARISLVAALMGAAAAAAAQSASTAASQIPPAHVGFINNDAMTMKGCRERLALPKRARLQDDDPRVDLDGVCRNMLGIPSPKPHSQRAASAASR